MLQGGCMNQSEKTRLHRINLEDVDQHNPWSIRDAIYAYILNTFSGLPVEDQMPLLMKIISDVPETDLTKEQSDDIWQNLALYWEGTADRYTTSEQIELAYGYLREAFLNPELPKAYRKVILVELIRNMSLYETLTHSQAINLEKLINYNFSDRGF